MTELEYFSDGRGTGRLIRRFPTTLLLAIACQLGCSNHPAPAPANPGGVSPLVSDDPARDGAALHEADRQLTEVRWQVIERKGPGTPSEQFFMDHRGEGSATTRPAAVPGKAGAQGPAMHGAIIQGHVRVAVNTATTQSASPSTQPAATRPVVVIDGPPITDTADVPIFSEEGLPVEVVPLMDGKIRIIWSLRNYGGTSVVSSRDPVTARRSVAITPPDLGPLVTVLQQQMGPAGSVMPLPKENTVIVTCERSMKSPVLDLLSKLDVAPRQVEIAARIFEVSRDFNLQQGAKVLAKHVGADNSQTGISLFDANAVASTATAAAAAAPGVGSVVSLVKVFEKAGITLDASFQILADEGLIRMVSSPRMTVAAGQTGYMLAGQELPIQTANFLNNVLQASTTYKPVGVQLYITPQSVGRDRIKLHTISIVSSVSGFTPVPTLEGSNPQQFLMNPIIDAREAETAVTVENGSTLVISGLRMSRLTTREEKVPGLGDIPVLGWMFKNHRTQRQLTDLYFFVTPTLLDEPTLPTPAPAAAIAIPQIPLAKAR